MLGKNISEIRKRKGLTLTELAERAGIAKSNLSNIERSLNQNPSINIIEKIAIVLGVDVDTLLNTNIEAKQQEIEEEWLELIHEFKESGVEKEQIQDLKTLMEFIKWQNTQEK